MTKAIVAVDGQIYMKKKKLSFYEIDDDYVWMSSEQNNMSIVTHKKVYIFIFCGKPPTMQHVVDYDYKNFAIFARKEY